jgi:hypothetical protein
MADTTRPEAWGESSRDVALANPDLDLAWHGREPDIEPETATEPDEGWLARDNEPDAGPWNTGLDGINQAGPEPEPEPEAG